jgi:hypothetical protein
MAFFCAIMYKSVCIVAFTYIVENFFDLLCINLWKTRKTAFSERKCWQMNLDELKLALDRIPKTGAINKARRRAIIILINKICAGEV